MKVSREELIELLERLGPSRATLLCRTLQISQPTLSRLVNRAGPELLVVGRARATRYAACRTVSEVAFPLPIYEIKPQEETPRHLANLYAVAPRGFYVEAVEGTQDSFHDGLPWFLQDLRPAGYLGRLAARLHHELSHPDDIRLWSDDQVIRYACRYGWDLPGAFILGDEVYRQTVDRVTKPEVVVLVHERERRYPELARDVLSSGVPGSSAAGEQPKFLTIRQKGGVPGAVLVKFSPPHDSPIGVRVADLLIAEHLAHATLADNGFPASCSEIVTAQDRTFLEVERFDRQGLAHRRGQVTLASLDSEFVGGPLDSWASTAKVLADQGVIPDTEVDRISWLSMFGRLIGNTDMHFGNLAFFMDGTEPAALAPVYDMLPMHYFPRHQELADAPIRIEPVVPRQFALARMVLPAAVDYWKSVSDDSRVSTSFRKIAATNAALVARVGS
jgi:hypothetical protein